ncbi:MAG: TIGR03792 family protein [Chlorogloeopsis fritschii C42_A2020_084]|uniref:TIGR03792 family protein n=1 Tax=Chlorogloeopsis fritschii TaxID=1124 RepID=UPI0019DC587E|nr:TIGR03792 family protein [Chlorogloeopsis fritschii]MBF2004783.1 TIGR03792 family protein [Chlorogloeopsis fritschii C42_A2020_084]
MTTNTDLQHCIELLKIKVPPAQREEYIHKDAEIWTAALANYPGFLGKQVWLNPKDPTEVILVIHWETREQWKAILQAELDAIEQKFNQELGFNSQIVEVCEYQVQSFL